MINKFTRSWFAEHPRRRFDKFTLGEIARLHGSLSSLALFDRDDKDAMYQFGLIGGELTSLLFVRYLCVNPSEPKPWIARKTVKHVIEYDEFSDYSTNVLTWLAKQPPTTNYVSLVHIQTIIRFLTTMEIQDG